jgi:hypothetical protein
LAVVLDRAFARRWDETLTISVITGFLTSLWLSWTAIVGSASGTQAEILFSGDAPWADRIAQQLVFYAQRVPDQIMGPVVEFITVFQTSNLSWGIANLWGFAATACVGLGLLLAASKPHTRLIGLIPLITGAVLLLWPHMEAGRFLIPLVPSILIGAAEGSTRLLILLARWRSIQLQPRRIRVIAAALLLAGSIPYPVYMLAAGRVNVLETSQRDFDSACDWLANHAERPGSVLSEHHGDVFCQSDRRGADVPTEARCGVRYANSESIACTVTGYQAAYLLTDSERYTRALRSPLPQFIRSHPNDVRAVFNAGAVTIFEVISKRGRTETDPYLTKERSDIFARVIVVTCCFRSKNG